MISGTEGKFKGLLKGALSALVFISGMLAAAMAALDWRIGADFQERTCIGRVFLFQKRDVLPYLTVSPQDFRNSLLAVELSRDWFGFRKGTLLLKEAGGVSGDLIRFSDQGLCLEAPGSGSCRLLPAVPQKWQRVLSRGFFKRGAQMNMNGLPAVPADTVPAPFRQAFPVPENSIFLNGFREEALDSRILGPFPLSGAAAVYRAVRIF